MAIRIKGWHIAVLVLVLLALWWGGYIRFEVGGIAQPTVPAADMVSVTKPIRFAVTDPLGGSAVSGATVTIYGLDKTIRETLTTDTTGLATTALPYTSGTTLYVKVVKSGYVTTWYTVTVPKMARADAESLTYNFVSLPLMKLGTFVIKVTDQFGNSYASDSTVDFNALGTNTVSLTISVYNTVDNSGYKTSTDFVSGITLYPVLVLRTEGSSVGVSGAGTAVTRGTTTYWMTTLSDESLIRQKIGDQYVKPGVTSVTVTFSRGSLGFGQTQSFEIELWIYFDPSYFASQGVGGPDAIPVATFIITFSGGSAQ